MIAATEESSPPRSSKGYWLLALTVFLAHFVQSSYGFFAARGASYKEAKSGSTRGVHGLPPRDAYEKMPNQPEALARASLANASGFYGASRQGPHLRDCRSDPIPRK